MRAVIIGNGSMFDYDYISSKLRPDDYIVCADGGYKHAKKLNVKPNVLIGDMDSIGDNDYDGEVINLPIRKDFTDSDVCIKFIMLKDFDEVMLLGFTGARIDHSITNLMLLKQFADAEKRAYILDEHNEIYFAVNENNIYGKKGDIVSIIPFGGNLCGITTQGLDYPLNDETLIFGESRGVSNIMSGDKCTISIKSGTGLIIKAKDWLDGVFMEPKDYILEKIDGEYAYLKDICSSDEVFIALALLPNGADVGTKLHFEMFEYSIIN